MAGSDVICYAWVEVVCNEWGLVARVGDRVCFLGIFFLSLREIESPMLVGPR